MRGKLERGSPEHLHLLQAVAEAFRPAAPIDRRNLFAGRTTQIRELFDVVAQPGQHAVVYGERGVGKTSLVTVVAGMLRAGEVVSARATCDRSDDFGAVWRKALDEIEITVASPGVGFAGPAKEAVKGASSLLPDRDVTPNSVRRALKSLTGEKAIVVFVDEFDRLASADARARSSPTRSRCCPTSSSVRRSCWWASRTTSRS